jgi:hypothetical protein
VAKYATKVVFIRRTAKQTNDYTCPKSIKKQCYTMPVANILRAGAVAGFGAHREAATK